MIGAVVVVVVIRVAVIVMVGDDRRDLTNSGVVPLVDNPRPRSSVLKSDTCRKAVKDVKDVQSVKGVKDMKKRT
jgi:hypothetical protein